MKGYKRRYKKKKGIFKLDCYCEKKVFDKFSHMYKIAKNMNDEKRFSKYFFKKYGIALIIFSLLPLLGLLLPLLFHAEEKGKAIINLCFSNCTKHAAASGQDDHKNKFIQAPFEDDKWPIIEYANIIFLYVSLITFLLVIFYALIKLVKYERLKAGKGKMSVKEYYSFCKNLLM
ncbi:hypothetical protein PVNG_05958 [Plasmodium vivax North Korean]|uniref:Variable surface protein Vir35 n=1 Tax=Plasmodium vivax North Korean TaxID=1035514 RepID=A0A0J9W707_PLAVI|nr:hypothetical protein PVNG_05958 [Plasmodium vivax North Korean]